MDVRHRRVPEDDDGTVWTRVEGTPVRTLGIIRFQGNVRMTPVSDQLTVDAEAKEWAKWWAQGEAQVGEG